MKINLIPDELRPTRPSPIPYMPLGGLVAISVIWLLTQFAVTAGVGGDLKDYKVEHRRLLAQLSACKELPGRLAYAENERDVLKLKGAAVTVLTKTSFRCSDIMQALAKTISAKLRLTSASVDYVAKQAVLKGYGSENGADIEVTLLLRSLNTNKAVLRSFSGAQLDYCRRAEHNGMHVKEFSIVMDLRPTGLETPRRPEADGTKGDHE